MDAPRDRLDAMGVPAPVPGRLALLDQGAAAIADVDRAWHFNSWFETDPPVEAAMHKIVGQSPRDLAVGDARDLLGGPAGMGHGFMWWSGAAWRLPAPQASRSYMTVLRQFAERTAPPLPEATCDRCDEEGGCWGAFVVAFSPHLVGLTFCPSCTYDLIWASPHRYLGTPRWSANNID